MAWERLNPAAERRVIHSERLTVARLRLAAAAVVAEHHHENEQLTMVMSGRLQFFYPGGELVVGPGQVLQIPPNVPHRVVALEDSEAIDLFAPVREDWLRGEDSYLRGRSR